MSFLRSSFFIFAITGATAVLAIAAPHRPATACTTGKPTITAGYKIPYYAPARPPNGAFEKGYQPELSWASEHLVGSYNFGVPEPVETGFAYAQYKCQYYCEKQSEGGSFFVRADEEQGSLCECFDELIYPEVFVNGDQILVGAWNAICKT